MNLGEGIMRATSRPFFVLLLVGGISGCGGAPGIVTLEPYLTETVYALGLGDQLRGVSASDDYPPETAGLVRVGTSTAPDLAAIEAIAPDVVFTPAAPGTGITARVVEAQPPRLDEIATLVRSVGQELGAAKAADSLAVTLETQRDDLRTALSGKQAPRTLIVLERASGSVDTLRCAGSAHLAAELAELAGTVNVLADRTEAEVQLTLAEVQALAPEAILEFMPGRALTRNQRQELFNDWNAAPEIPARKTARIYCINESHALRPGPRIFEVARQIALTIHGNFEFERELSARAETAD